MQQASSYLSLKVQIDHRSQRHWTHVCRHLLIDMGLIVSSFILAASLRFEVWLPPQVVDYMPAMLLAAGVSAAMLYISGLYSLYAPRRKRFVQNALIVVAISVGLLTVLGYGSIDFSARIGRGVLLISVPFIVFFVFSHHLYFVRRGGRYRERLACLVSNDFHAQEARLIQGVEQDHTEFVGVITIGDHVTEGSDEFIGKFDEIESVVRNLDINCLLCPPGTLDRGDVMQKVRRLRYSGVNVFSLADMCEDLFQAVPLRLVTSGWLLHCSGQPRLFYVRKLKRIFDILASLLCLVVSSPFFLLAMLAVKLTSRGPIFYCQERCGRFGRKFNIVKLRTMKVDAEAEGPRLSSLDDERLTPTGVILRKFRLDEIPQLWMVLKGDMSFVGPRPEREEFIDQLSQQIPCFPERVMVQPGITGWAQVNYPYGSTVEDAERKLEYDLYYMKHMGILLDCFVILDTIRTVFLGGARKEKGMVLAKFSNSLRRALEDEVGSDLRAGN